MEEKILVAYATKYGSTREVAEAVAAALNEAGVAAEAQPARAVRSLVGYRAVVLGAPLYIGNFLGEANKFLTRCQAELTHLPVAFFALGPTKAGEDWQGPRDQMNQRLAQFPWFKPVAVEMFGGLFDPARLRFPDSLLLKMPASPLKDEPKTDARDWDAIRAWARTLPEKLPQ